MRIIKKPSDLGYITVNSEIFVRVLISPNFAYTKFCENKTREMAKALCSLLLYVYHVLVANF